MNKEDKKSINRKGILGGIIGFGIMTILFSIYSKNNSKTLESGIKEGVLQYSKTLPQRIDEYSVLDSLIMPSDKVLNYYYTIDIDKDEADYALIKENIDAPSLNNIKTSDKLKDFRQLKYTWHYLYFDKNGVLFHEYIITPDMYQ